MKKLLIVLSIFIIASCNDESASWSKTRKQEKGFIVAMQYAAPIDGSGSTVTYTPSSNGGGVGFGSTSIHTDEKYMVVFRCEHGVVFSIDRQALYAKLSEKDSVVIDYWEFSDAAGVTKELDFIDANPLKQ
jgi:hypothetical protein